jgi:Eukaryotic mitochondrial regulator protein
MAIPYAHAVQEMVPTTPLGEKGEPQPVHESINDLPVHRLTDPQIFYPVSESRQFTRVDAGRVFSAAPALERDEEATVTVESLIAPETRRFEKVGKGDEEHQVLLPADARIPHPQLIALERDKIRNPSERRENMDRYQERLKRADELEQQRKQLAKEKAERKLTRIQPEESRFEFRFKDVVVSKETTGPDGRGHSAPGHRYGVPTYDRKKGQVKIPTKVEV